MSKVYLGQMFIQAQFFVYKFIIMYSSFTIAVKPVGNIMYYGQTQNIQKYPL